MDSLSKSDILVIARAFRTQLSEWTDIVREVNAQIREHPDMQFLAITPRMIRSMLEEMIPTLEKVVDRATRDFPELIPDLVQYRENLETALGDNYQLVSKR